MVEEVVWFAWRPVRVGSRLVSFHRSRWAWLRYVKRLYPPAFGVTEYYDAS